MKAKWKMLLGFFLLLCLTFLGLFYYQNLQQADEKILLLYGNVDIRDVALGFRVPGKVERVLYEEGDKVHQGDILAYLDKEPYEEELDVVKAELAVAVAELKDHERDYERFQRLVKVQVISTSEYDRALKNKEMSAAQVEKLKNQIKRLQTSLSDTTLKAPADGVILTRTREPGSIIAAGDPVYTLAIENNLWVRTFISEINLGKIHPGMSAKIFTDAYPNQPYSGHVGYISPEAEFTPKNVQTTELRTDLVYRVRVLVDNPDSGLRQGMPVTVELSLQPHAENRVDAHE